VSTNLLDNPGALIGRTVYSNDGEKIGKVDDVLADENGRPMYLETRSGWFSNRRHVIPLHGLDASGDDLTVPYTKTQLRNAPTFGDADEIDYDQERALGAHYGHDVSEWDDAHRRDALAGEDLSEGPTPETRHPTSGRYDDVEDTTQGPTPETRVAMRADKDDPAAAGQPATDARTRAEVGGDQDRDVDVAARRPGATGEGVGTGDSLTRSEEELRVGTHRESAGRVRLRKWVDTERVSETVPVEHERVTVRREPLAGGDVGDARIGEQDVEMTLEEEVVDVDKDVVAKERVSLDKDVEVEQRTVEADLRRERVEVDGDEELRRSDDR
jgi:uncharacterized protein (TIGR02271 family)